MSHAEQPSWQGEDSRWRAAVDKVRAGRSLKPKRSKDGARACGALSFGPDHESGTLREGSTSPGRSGDSASVPDVPRRKPDRAWRHVIDEGK